LGTVSGVFIQLNKGTWVKQQLNAFASGPLAFLVLLLNGGLTGGVNSLVVALFEVRNLSSGGRKIWGFRQRISSGAFSL
jgi:hypothetical protein